MKNGIEVEIADIIYAAALGTEGTGEPLKNRGEPARPGAFFAVPGPSYRTA